MPSHQWLLTKGLSIGELPIFPFLAPRVFQPWPKHIRSSRAHGTNLAPTCPGHAPEVENLLAFSSAGFRWAAGPRNTQLRDSWPLRYRTLSTSSQCAGTDSDEESFQKSYADIWGLARAKKRFQNEVNLPPEDVADILSVEMDKRTQPIVRRIRGQSYHSRDSTVRERVPTVHKRVSAVQKRAPTVRTEYVRLTIDRNWRPFSISRLEAFSPLWSYNFTRLSRKYDSLLRRYRRPRRFGVVDTSRFQEGLVNASVQEIRKAWEGLSRTERKSMWIHVMLDALGRRPSWALKFLIATTSSEPYPPSYAISDSIQYLVVRFLYKGKNPDDKSVTALFDTVMGLLDECDHYYLHLSQRTIFYLLSHINIDQAEHFYKVLVHRSHPLHENTLLQFAHAFGLNGRTQLAVNVLQHFHNNGGDFAQPKVESVCSTILERKNRKNSNGVMSDSNIFGFLLDLGIRPNIILYNILVQNAAESGDPETAWKIHDMMSGLGIEADARTYSILLNDAKMRLDVPAMKRIAEIVESKGIINEYIITDLLHAMFLTYEQERKTRPIGTPPPAPFKRMLALYAEYFDLEPIRGLLTQGYRNFTVPSDRPKMHPSKATLVVMLTALLRGFTNPTSAPEWYHRFRTMVLSGHPDIMPLTESTHIYDAVIMSLGRWPMTLRLCTKVIGDMFSSYSAAQKAQNRLHDLICNEKVLQTAMGSFSASASTQHLSVHRLQKGVMDSRTSQKLDALPEGGSAVEPSQDVDAINESPPRNSRSIELLHTASNVAAEDSTESADQVVIHGHCKPSVQTWSILLKAFMDHSQPRAAEKVLTMMRHRGITPNHVTWNSLAIGYARLQDITNSVDVIDRFEREGWEMSDTTVEGLEVIENRKALMEALREKDLRRIKKQRAVQEALDWELTSAESGSLHDVVHKEQLVNYFESPA
jgi:pentatricopeptide repeat protein